VAVKKVTLQKTIDWDFNYSGGSYSGTVTQICIDTDSMQEIWTNAIKNIPKPIAKNSHDSVEAQNMIWNFKRLTRLFRIHGYLSNTEVKGTHDGGDDKATLTDSTADFLAAGVCKGMTVSNTTDGSSGTITAVTATTVTATLSGGTDDDWDDNDEYEITQNATTKEQLLKRMIWDGNAGSNASLSIPGESSPLGATDLPTTQNMTGFITSLAITRDTSHAYSEYDTMDANTKIFDVTIDFMIGDAA
jgi:hypothetical protein